MGPIQDLVSCFVWLFLGQSYIVLIRLADIAAMRTLQVRTTNDRDSMAASCLESRRPSSLVEQGWIYLECYIISSSDLATVARFAGQIMSEIACLDLVSVSGQLGFPRVYIPRGPDLSHGV